MYKRFIPTVILSSVAAAFMLVATPTISVAEEDSAIARGGLLYDKWYKVIGAAKPKDTHKAWPASNTKKKGAATWRCKACHGWDLRGKDGAYSKGSYLTGIKGLRAMEGVAPAKIIAFMQDDTHGLKGMMADQDFSDLALFVSKGQIDMTKYINADKSINGDAAQGAAYFNTLCSGCHGVEGRLPKELPKTLGKFASGNPWETIAKVQNGQPGESMPALRALPLDVTIDIVAYMITMPQE